MPVNYLPSGTLQSYTPAVGSGWPTPVYGTAPQWVLDDTSGSRSRYRVDLGAGYAAQSYAYASVAVPSNPKETVTGIGWDARVSGSIVSGSVTGVLLVPTLLTGTGPLDWSYLAGPSFGEVAVPNDSTLRDYTDLYDAGDYDSWGGSFSEALDALYAGMLWMIPEVRAAFGSSGSYIVDLTVTNFRIFVEYDEVDLELPVLRQHPRSDGRGVSSARRHYPPAGSVQAGLRRAGGVYL